MHTLPYRTTASSSLFVACIVEEVGDSKAAIVEEARGLREGDATRPGDMVVLDFTTPSRYLIMDGVVTTVYMNSIMPNKVAAVPGFSAKGWRTRSSSLTRPRPTRYRWRTEDGTNLFPLRWKMAA